MTEGKLAICPAQKAQLAAALKKWPDIAVDVTIAPFQETRRARANRFLFGVIYKLIAQETGHSVDDLHEYFKARHNSKVIEFLNVETGEMEERRIAQTTTKLSIQEFSDYMERVMVDGAELCGVVFPEPRESEDWRERKAAA